MLMSHDLNRPRLKLQSDKAMKMVPGSSEGTVYGVPVQNTLSFMLRTCMYSVHSSIHSSKWPYDNDPSLDMHSRTLNCISLAVHSR